MNTYRYRSHIAWMRPVIPALFLLLDVLILRFFILIDWTFFGIVLGIFFLGEAWLIWQLLDRLAKVEVTLGEDGIVYRGKKGTIEMRFEEIRRFQYPSIPYMGGWLKIVSDAGTVRLTVVVENIGQFVRELKEQMDRSELSSRYNQARLFRFYKTAEYADQSWLRVYENLANGVAVLILAVAAGWMASFDMEGLPPWIPLPALWIGCAVIWALLVYLFAEIELMRRFARDSDEASFTVPERNPPAERVLCRKAFSIGAVLFVAGAIVIRVFVG